MIFNQDKLYEIIKHIVNQKFTNIVVLVDQNTGLKCMPLFNTLFGDSLGDYHILTTKSGEENKTMSQVMEIHAFLVGANIDRNSLIINLGGGLLSDIGGFAASIYKRGIEYVNIPTTLLAMVDAAIGGKTGVNLLNIKNQIGTFKKPNAIYLNTSFLETLDEVQLKSGFAELVKYGLIADKKLWEVLKNSDYHNYQSLFESIAKAAEIKNRICEIDPDEEGIRKILNFGHTVGHALETFFLNNGNEKTHGECVAAGMIMESHLSMLKGYLQMSQFVEIKGVLLEKFGKLKFSQNEIEALIYLMGFDKKNAGKEIKVVRLDEIGKCTFTFTASKEELKMSLHYYLSL